MNNLKIIIAIALALFLGYTVGHWNGVSDGKGIQRATQAITATKEVVKATTDREKVDDETRKIPDTAIDAELHSLGVLRD